MANRCKQVLSNVFKTYKNNRSKHKEIKSCLLLLLDVYQTLSLLVKQPYGHLMSTRSNIFRPQAISTTLLVPNAPAGPGFSSRDQMVYLSAGES